MSPHSKGATIVAFLWFVAGCESRLMPTFGSDKTPKAEPPPPPVVLRASARPRLKVTKEIIPGASVACMRDCIDGTLSLEASCAAPSPIGGRLKLVDQSSLEWARMWLFTGLADAATKVQLRTSVDLRTGRTDGAVSIGLRRKVCARGVSFVHRQPIDGLPCRCHVDVGATLVMPDELRLAVGSGSSGLRELAEAARVELDADRLELCLIF